MSNTIPLLILYGSATGTAESIAKRIMEEAFSAKYFHPIQLCTLNDSLKNEQKLLKEYHHWVIVCSTTGNGDAPENADRFVRQMKRKATNMKNEQISEFVNKIVNILGLGDTNYDKFCQAAKEIHSYLKVLQVKELLSLGCADDGTGLEQVVEPWIESLWNTYKSFYENQVASSSSKISEEEVSSKTAVEEETQLEKEMEFSSCFIDVNCQSSTFSEEILEPNFDSWNQHSQSRRIVHTQYNPFMASVKAVRYLTTSNDKQVLHMEFNIYDERLDRLAFKYKPGDAIGIYPSNPKELVQQFLSRIMPELNQNQDLQITGMKLLDTKKEALIPDHLKRYFQTEELDNKFTSLRQLLTHHIDILAPVTIQQLRILSQYCEEETEKFEMIQISSNANDYRLHVANAKAGLLDILLRYPSCKPPLSHLLLITEPIRPRFYSITSSPLIYPDCVHICFTVVKYQTPPPWREDKKGHCSNMFLKETVAAPFLLFNHTNTLTKSVSTTVLDAPEYIKVPIFLKDTPEFTLDPDVSKPVIMIGPGTGIAPFRAFLQHRFEMKRFLTSNAKEEKTSKEVLFHGCRRRESDFLYREELLKMQQQHYRSFDLLLACSQERIGAFWYGGTYVQDLLREYGFVLCELMDKEHQGIIYVCGDAHGMARQVHNVLIEILMTHKKGINTKEDAQRMLEQWEQEKRYQKDVWTS